MKIFNYVKDFTEGTEEETVILDKAISIKTSFDGMEDEHSVEVVYKSGKKIILEDGFWEEESAKNLKKDLMQVLKSKEGVEVTKKRSHYIDDEMDLD